MSQTTGLEKKLESLLRKAILEFKLIEKHKDIAVALSGGKDSLTLLYLLNKINGLGVSQYRLHPIYVSGQFSCGASVSIPYLTKFCQEMGLNFHVVESQKVLSKLECYSCSRIRRSLLFAKAKELGATCIAFGHHRDDLIQTLLMNLFHKGEFSGMLPKLQMEKYEIDIVRPLYYITEQQIIQFAKSKGFFRIMCQCPVGQNSVRKQTNKMIADIETIFPNLRSNLAHALKHYGSDKASKS